ncbi:MAG: single-stranded DNA-binding protein [Candidatus Peregrinibacteria bacterium]|nr:single-stranded DNA-binding protein [Candidatus Peregrinibacteria bacterium]MDZ4244429.1 single-stranded DNA-binding protein [Candidatus Gracilibacteria bacterium]
MRSVNKVILVGNVTRDPDTRQTQNGQKIVTFGLATNRQWKSASGDKQDQAEFHELVAWSRLADLCEKYVRKGKLLYVEGYLKTRSWDTPEGVRRFKTEVVVQDLIMLEKKSGEDDDFDYHQDDDASYDEAPAKPVAPVADKVASAAVAVDAVAPEVESEVEKEEAPVVSAADPNEDFNF